MKTDNLIILLGSGASAVIATVPFFASHLLSAEGAAGICSVIGLLLIAALDHAPRHS